MKKQTTASANQVEISTLDMWLNSENKLFTNLFAETGESIMGHRTKRILRVGRKRYKTY